MKIAIPWSANHKLQYGDEYNIGFDNEKNNFDTLFDFLQEHKDIRFNIESTNMTIQQMIAASCANENVHFRIIELSSDLLNKLKEEKLKFFFGARLAASSFSLLEEQILFGATDVYIVDDLCYQLDRVKKICSKHGVNTRMILNRIPSRRLDKGTNPKSPIFIPEKIDKLSEYIDIGEFDTTSWAKIGTYYRIWFERKKWRDNLRYIYQDLEIDIPNQSLIPNFMEYKMNCGYKCAYGSVCNKCEQFIEIAQDLYNKHIEYMSEKEID